MQFLVDQNVPLDVVEGLRGEGHDVTWAQTVYPGADDETLLKAAQQEGRILLTFDTDFGALAFDRDLPASSGIILFRLTPVSPTAVAETVLKTIRSRTGKGISPSWTTRKSGCVLFLGDFENSPSSVP